jgi:hypothetical protein
MFESVRAHLQSSIAQRSNHLHRIEDHLTEIRNFVSVGKEHAQAVRYLKQQRAFLAKKQAIEKKLLFAVVEARFHHQNQADLPWYLLETLFGHK